MNEKQIEKNKNKPQMCYATQINVNDNPFYHGIFSFVI